MAKTVEARTVLAQMIRRRRLTLEEFAERLDVFARANGEIGTLSPRHVQRLVSGTITPDQVRPANARLLEHYFGCPLVELLSEPQDDGAHTSGPVRDPGHRQAEWLKVRSAPGVRGRELSELAAWLYPDSDRAAGGHVLSGPRWLTEGPVDLDSVELDWTDDHPPYTFPGTVSLDHVLPPNEHGTRYADYSRAVRDLVRPRLLENRLSYRLVGVRNDGALTLRFHHTTFFEVFNLKQMVAHEFKLAWLQSGRSLPRFDALPLRAAIGDPFDPGRLLMSPGINTLTIRRGGARDEPEFVLHERDGAKVADGGGLCHVAPSGEFQPSTTGAASMRNDFSLWRNIMRELSEEFLGNAEHDGCDRRAIDYAREEPFSRFEEAKRSGSLRVWHYGLVIEPLELGVQQLTVAVVDAPTFDSLFADMVEVNDEGVLVGKGGSKRMPFSAEAIDRLEPRLSASALTLLRTAWRDRRTLVPA